MPAWRQTSFTGTPASACLRIETIWVSVNFDFFIKPPGWETMPESSTSVLSTDQGSLRPDSASANQILAVFGQRAVHSCTAGTLIDQRFPREHLIYSFLGCDVPS